VPLKATRGQSTSYYYHTLTNYISHNSLPGLIITDCIHLCLITLLVSVYLFHVHSFDRYEVLYVVALHFRAFFLVSCLLDFLPVLWIIILPLSLTSVCLFVWTAYLCFDLLPVLWITCLDCPFIKAAFGSQLSGF